MFATHVSTKDLSQEVLGSALQEHLRQASSLVSELALEGRDLLLEQLRDELKQAIASELAGQETDSPQAVHQELLREIRTRFAEQLTAIKHRANLVADGLHALETEWRYLDRHSMLGERRKREILMHLSCSGQLEDRYELMEQIDSGGQTKIYRARCKETNEMCALKVLKAKSRSALLSRFLIEGSVGKKQLHHERLVRIFDYGGFFSPEQHEGTYYIACELLEGMTLHHWIRQHTYTARLTDPHLHLLEQMVESLQYLHSEGFIHCDVNPFNFFVTHDSDIKLLDFGIIESITEIQKLSASQAISATQSVGGPTYQAPEQIDSLFGKPTPKTDVYALGVTLFEMFTGQLPFGTRLDGNAAAQAAPVQPLPTRPRDLTQAMMPLWLDALIVRCLEKDPKSRPTLDAVGSILEHLVDFKVDTERMIPLIQDLCKEGFDPEKVLQEKITVIRSQFLGTLSPEETRFVPMERLERAESQVVERVHSQIQTNENQLQTLISRMEPWDPLLQTCPNLLCRADYQRGKRSCPVCHTSWTMSCGASGDHQNSFFTDRCQDPHCDTYFSRTFKIEEAYRKTLSVALEEQRCAEAAMVLLVIGEHLLGAGESVHFHKYYEKCLEELGPQREAEQKALFDSMRDEWRELIEEAKQGFRNLHPQVRQSLLLDARLLCDEERLRDALQVLGKFPPQANDSEVTSLRNELHEKLTAGELSEANQRWEHSQKRMQQMETELDDLTPVEDRHPGSNSISGWLTGVNDPLATGEKGLDDVAAPMRNAMEMIQVSEELVEQSNEPLEKTLRPIHRSAEELKEVHESILELKDAFTKNQLKGVEGKLEHAQNVIETTEDILKQANISLLSIQGKLDQARVKLGHSRDVLGETDAPFKEVQYALTDAQQHFEMLETSSKEAQPRLESVRRERKELQTLLDSLSTVVNEITYPSDKQEFLLEQTVELQGRLVQSEATLKSREQQHEKLSNEAKKLLQQMKKIQTSYEEELERQDMLSQQAASAQKEESKARKLLEQGQLQVRKQQEQIKQLRNARDEWWQLEQKRRSRVLHTAITWGTVGSSIGIAFGLLLGWWLFARTITLQKPGWFESILWGGSMGLVMTLAVTFALGRKVFDQPHVIIVGGTIAAGAIGLVLHLMGFVMLGSSVGVLFGAVIGWVIGGGLGALWNVRRLKPWRTLEKSIKSARFGALFGVFAGASAGSYIGHTQLLQASSFTWVFLTLGCVSLFGLIGVTVGYFFAGGAWDDLKLAAEVD